MSTAALPLDAPVVMASPSTFRIFLNEARFEFVRMLRTRTFSLSVIGFPLVFYIFFGLLLNRGQSFGGLSMAKLMLAGYAVFGCVGAALFGIGVGMAAELNAGWLELKRASPMPPIAYLLAKCTTAMAFGVIIVSLLAVLGITLGHVHLSGAEYARMMGLTVAGALPFAAMGLLLALTVPANAAPGVTNMLYLPMSFLGGLWIPVEFLPRAIGRLAPAFPTYHLKQLMLGAFGYAAAGRTLNHWLYLAGFTLVMLAAAGFAFRRIEQNS